MITSDHGESFGEHGLFDHQYGLYEPLIRVPLVARWPELGTGGRVEDGLVQLVDVFPSIAALAGSSVPVGDPWASSTMFEEPDRSFAAAEYLVPNLRAFQRRFPDANTKAFDSAIRSIRDERFKFILRRDGRAELYDLIEDPDEIRNLCEAQPERAQRMEALIEERLGPWPEDLDAGAGGDLDPLRERLEQLGYL